MAGFMSRRRAIDPAISDEEADRIAADVLRGIRAPESEPTSLPEVEDLTFTPGDAPASPAQSSLTPADMDEIVRSTSEGILGDMRQNRPEPMARQFAAPPVATEIPQSRVPDVVASPNPPPASVSPRAAAGLYSAEPPVILSRQATRNAAEADLRARAKGPESFLGAPEAIAEVQRMKAMSPSVAEQQALHDAERIDTRRQRLGMARRIGSGLAGVVGALTGSDLLMGAGMMGLGMQRPEQPSELERVQAGVDRRIGYDRTQNEVLAAQQAATARYAQAEREAGLDERRFALQEQGAQSDIALNQARLDEMQREAEESDFQRQAIEGNAAGMRRFIRGRAEAIVHQGSRDPILSAINDPSFESVTDMQALIGMKNTLDQLDRRRGGGGSGGSGGGRSTGVYNPATGEMERTRPRGPAMPPREGVAIPARPGVPSAAPAGEPPTDAASRTEADWITRTMTLAGYDMSTEEAQNAREGYARDIAEGGAVETAARAELRGLSNQAARGRIDEGRYAQLSGEVEEARNKVRAMHTLRVGLENAIHNGNPRVVQAALNGDATAAAALGLPRLYAQMVDVRDRLGRSRSGAAIPVTEAPSFQTILGMGSVFNDPRVLIARLREFEDEAWAMMQGQLMRGGTAYRDRWNREHNIGERRR